MWIRDNFKSARYALVLCLHACSLFKSDHRMDDKMFESFDTCDFQRPIVCIIFNWMNFIMYSVMANTFAYLSAVLLFCRLSKSTIFISFISVLGLHRRYGHFSLVSCLWLSETDSLYSAVYVLSLKSVFTLTLLI